MTDQDNNMDSAPQRDANTGSATLAAPTKTPKRGKPKQLPLYKVLLHNDDVNVFEHVIMSIVKITSLSLHDAELRTLEANNSGVALLLVTHRERAELYEEQFRSCNLIVTIEPDA